MGAVWLLCVLGYALRSFNFAAFPALGDNQDEVAWAWSGLTLITRHVPYAWSYLPHYRSATLVVVNGASYPLVHPYLDHPPVFSLLVGGETWLLGARTIEEVTTVMTRPLVIGLSTLSIFLMYLLARQVVGRGPALAAAALFATAPITVLLGRVVESEALLSPLLLGSLLIVQRLVAGRGGRRAVAGLFAICVVASLTKVPGAATGLACGAILVAAGRWRLALLPPAGALLGLLLYVAYGALVDWSQFLAVIADQGARREGVMGAYEFITAPAGIGTAFRDGWWILGWAGLVAIGLQRSLASRALVWPALTVTLAIMLLGAESLVARYGWYRIYIYPLLYIGAGYACWEALRRASIPWLVLVLVLGGATTVSLALGYGSTNSGPPVVLVALAALLVLGPALAAEMAPSGRRRTFVAQGVAAAAFVVLLAANSLESFFMASLKQTL